MPTIRADLRQTSSQNAKRAAQYLRMSTEHQKYSTENQSAAIAKYAEQRGLTIVRTYQDDGKSGLNLKGRAALKELLDDAMNGRCDFATVLILDVSRWGRFQDVDESAYYEFICKAAGVKVVYCAEQFENDGSLISGLVKNIKRVMAAEYSRQLSARVFAGQCRIVAKGYRLGGSPGFGLRRLLVDQHGKPKIVLKPGESKSLATDRVILVPGPAAEVALVRRIFKLFVFEKLPAHRIARKLNGEVAAVRQLGRKWTHHQVWRLLKEEKYIGNNVFNRLSRKMKQKSVHNPPEMWVRVDDCFLPVVEKELFLKANQIVKDRAQKRGNKEYMLDCLRALLVKRGRLSRAIISSSKLSPSAETYDRVFGNVTAAYQLIGYDQTTAPQILSRKNGKFAKLPRCPESKLNARNSERTRLYRARKRERRRSQYSLLPS